ncbi:hypothetical protein PG993_002534 [Apiospora rasikravindrae]|uniref:Uncharacterized protein n=1 Tax=Apiospora rasikravindrae TaxID=990691 RepID=A0ABR1TWX1_9PEZI
MASFQINPNARPFVSFRALSAHALGLSAQHASENTATPGVSSTNNSSNTVECQAIFQYHTCNCRTRNPIWVCGKPQSQCSHPNPSLLVSGLPLACCADTKVGARAVKQQQQSKKGKKNQNQNQQTGPRTEACTAQDPGNVGWRGDTDAALHTQVLTLDTFPGLTAEDFDEIVPVFVEDGKCWREEVQARHRERRVAAYAEETESSEPGTNSDDSSSSEDEDDDSVDLLAELLEKTNTRKPAAASAVPACESDVGDDEAEYDCDDEDEDEKVKQPSLRSLVKASVADPKEGKKKKKPEPAIEAEFLYLFA